MVAHNEKILIMSLSKNDKRLYFFFKYMIFIKFKINYSGYYIILQSRRHVNYFFDAGPESIESLFQRLL